MQEKDFEWFIENHDSLFKKYGDVYLVIKNKKVLSTYTTYAEAVEQTSKTEKLGTFIVQKCTGTSEGYTNQIASNEIVFF